MVFHAAGTQFPLLEVLRRRSKDKPFNERMEKLTVEFLTEKYFNWISRWISKIRQTIGEGTREEVRDIFTKLSGESTRIALSNMARCVVELQLYKQSRTRINDWLKTLKARIEKGESKEKVVEGFKRFTYILLRTGSKAPEEVWPKATSSAESIILNSMVSKD